MENLKITISKGNAKMGAIPSVSLPSCVTCRPDAPCFKACYARRMEARRKNVRDSYQHNLDVLTTNPKAYWAQVESAMAANLSFRFHVSGDIPSYEYLEKMVDACKENSHCQTLVFTKRYELVNAFIATNGGLPDNLHIMFSGWGKAWNEKIPNPYKLPMVDVIFSESEASGFNAICGGNCSECRCKGTGCWELKKGEKLGIYKH